MEDGTEGHPAVHADGNVVGLERVGEGFGGELAANLDARVAMDADAFPSGRHCLPRAQTFEFIRAPLLYLNRDMTMPPITGTASIAEEDDVVAPPGPPHTYFGVAQSMMPGVTILAAASPSPPLALCHIAAHVLECLLKAYLSKDGSDAEVRNPKVHHDLDALWGMAFARGLRVPQSPPEWVDRLSGLHKRPYHLRYSTEVHGIVSPSPEPMASELRNLLETVREQLR